MKSLWNIFKEDSDKHNFQSEFFTGNAYTQYITDVTNIQGDKDSITEEDINAGLNGIANLVLPHNAALKKLPYLIGVAHKLEDMLVR